MEEDVGVSSFIPALYKPAALLPIARHKESLLYLVETYPVTIVVGQTGSGKTTQIPQFLDQAGWCADGKLIAVTQVSLFYRFCVIALILELFLATTSRRHYCCHTCCGRNEMSARSGSWIQHPI